MSRVKLIIQKFAFSKLNDLYLRKLLENKEQCLIEEDTIRATSIDPISKMKKKKENEEKS